MSGFNLDRSQSDADTCGKLFSYGVDAAHATILAIGDVVVLTGTGAADGTAEVDAAAAGAPLTGIIAGFDPIYEGEQLSDTGLPATTGGTAHCHVAQYNMYVADVSNGPLLVADIGLNADIVATAATKTGGLTTSNMTINASTKAATQTLQFRIVALKEDSAGVLGNRALVRVNATTTSDGAAGV